MGNAALYSRPFHPVTALVASGSNFMAESAVVKNASFSSRLDLLTENHLCKTLNFFNYYLVAII